MKCCVYCGQELEGYELICPNPACGQLLPGQKLLKKTKTSESENREIITKNDENEKVKEKPKKVENTKGNVQSGPKSKLSQVRKTYPVADGTESPVQILKFDELVIEQCKRKYDKRLHEKISLYAQKNILYFNNTKINENAFRGWQDFQILVIGENVQMIGSNAFSNCNSLECIYIEGYASRILYIGSRAFANCRKLKYVIDMCWKGTEFYNRNVFDGCEQVRMYLDSENTYLEKYCRQNKLECYSIGRDGCNDTEYFVIMALFLEAEELKIDSIKVK